MADSKITALTSISTSTDPANDPLVIVDVSDTSMAATGTTKKVTLNELLGASGTATLASATITGDLTVKTNVLKVDSTNNRVGIGTASPSFALEVVGSAGISGNATSNGFIVSGASSVPGAGMWGLATALAFNVNSTEGMRLTSTGLGVGVTPSYKLDVQGQSIRLNSGSATGFAVLRLGGNASDSFFGFAGLANDIVTGSSAGDTVIGSNKAGANLRFISGNGTLNATLDASGRLLVAKTASATGSTGCELQTGAGGNSASVFTADGAFASIMNRLTSDGIIVDLRRQTLSVGNISVTTTGATFNSTSDYRLKEDVQPLVGGLARVSALKPSIYKWKSDGSNGEGFLAHELAEVVPFAVTGEKDAVNEDGSIKAQGVDLSRVVPILVAAIQELAAEVNALKNA